MKKDDLRQPDAFVATSNVVLSWIEKHALPIFSAVVIAIVLSLGYLGYSFLNRYQESKAAAAIYNAEAELKQKQNEFTPDMENPTAKVSKVADFEKDYKPSVEKVMGALKAQEKSQTALVSSLRLAAFLAENKRWPEAMAALEIPKYSPRKSELLFGLFNLQRGLVWGENGKWDEAIGFYQQILDSKDQKLLHPEAMLKMGLSFEAKKDFVKAKSTYEKVIQDFANSDSANQAQQFLKLLDQKGAA